MQDALERQVGVVDVKVNIQTNWVTMSGPKDRAVPLPRIEMAIRRAGYRPSKMSVTAIGRFEAGDAGRSFRIRGWPEGYAVAEPVSPPAGLCRIQANVKRAGASVRLEVLKISAESDSG